MQSWYPWPERVLSAVVHRDPAKIRSHTRDLYIAPATPDSGRELYAMPTRKSSVGCR